MNDILVSKSTLPPLDEYIEKIRPMWDSHWITNNGSIQNEFEKEIRNFLLAQECTLFVNGHLALDLAIKALGLRGEVITTPFTFASTTHAISLNGLKPVFCDISPVDFNIDVTKIEALINEKTTAIIPVHVYGNPCNVEAIQEISDKYDLKVIYDAAHAFGVEVGDIGIGNFGDFSMFSFHAAKVFHSIEGGALIYKDPSWKEILDSLKNFGIGYDGNYGGLPGLNAKMNEFQAAMGSVNLKYLSKEISARREVYCVYKALLSDISGFYFIPENEKVKHNYSYAPILIDPDASGVTRDELTEELRKHGIYARKYFYPLTSDLACYSKFSNSNSTPVAKKVSDNILALPLYGELIENVNGICEIIYTIINSRIR